MKCLNVNDPTIKRLLGFIPSEPLLSKLIDKVGDDFTEQQILDEYQLLNKNDVTGSELVQMQEVTKANQSAYKQLVDEILSDVKATAGKFIDKIVMANEKTDNPYINSFLRTFKNIGYGAMLKHYNTMILAEDRPLGTEYHEAFHAYENNIFSEPTRNAIYKRVADLTGEKLSKKVASERLAEMYRVYAVNRKLSESIKKAEDKSFFQKIFDFINNFFSDVNRLYQD